MPFTSESLRFLADLAKNNRREWFDPRKEEYKQKVLAPMLELVSQLNENLASFAPTFRIDPQKSIFRVYRDIRFSKDKRPYKTNVAALFWDSRVGKNRGPAFYVSVSPEELMVAGGLYSPGNLEALTTRQHIASHHQRLRAILDAKQVRRKFREMEGETLQRAPKGFAPDHPAIELLKQKSWVLTSTEDSQICLKPRFATFVSSAMQALAPFVLFLNEPFAAQAKRPKEPLLVGSHRAR